MTDLQPDKEEMLTHLNLLYEGVHAEALIELAWTDPQGSLSQARLFPVPQIDVVASEAVRWNVQERNIYIGVCPRKPDAPALKRSSDKHVLCVPWLWCDWDAPGTAENASHLWLPHPPMFRVITGTHPHQRAHGYFPLLAPYQDTRQNYELVRPVLQGMAHELNGDPMVCNPGRVLRLAGSIAHPVKEGRVPELVRVQMVKADAGYEMEALAKRFATVEHEPARARGMRDAENQASHHYATNSLGIQTVLDDGRENYMYRTVAACLREFYATHRRPPTPEELFNVAWPQFAEHTDWQRPPERGPDQMMQKCSYALARQARGDIPGMRNVEEAIETHRARVAAPRQNTSCNGPLPPGVQLEDFYGYMVEHKYIFTPTGQVWPASSVDGRIPKVGNVKASKWLDENRAVEQMTWAPGEPIEILDRLIAEGGWFDRPGCRVFNLYRPAVIQPCAGEAAPWLRHVEQLYGNDAEHIIRWCAHRVQRPYEKINHALVLGGKQGVGKDTLLEPVKQAVGPWNFIEVSPKQVLGRFNGFLKSVVLRVSEARDLGEFDRFAFYDHMKAVTAAPPDVLRVDEKNRQEYSIPNITGVVITTNHKSDGIYLPADDRRHFVAWTDLDKSAFTPEYWKTLWHWYAHGGIEIIANYLRGLDLTAFNAKQPPPQTEAFFEIVNSSRAPEDAALADALEALGSPNAVTLEKIAAVTDQQSLRDFVTDCKSSRRIPHRMEECGYVPVRNPHAKDGLWKVSRRRQAIYAKQTLTTTERLVAATHLG